MNEHTDSPVAVVGLAAIMPDAPDATSFWQNLRDGRYSISDVPPERWDPELYYDPDPAAVDKTYSRIGGWVREHPWEPQQWRLPIPPKVAAQFDVGQQWAVSAARSALLDAGWPQWTVDPERVAVILGNAIGGDKHYRTSLRVQFPEFARDLREVSSFTALPAETRAAILDEWHERFLSHEPDITEDTMPGELSNVLAGRIANLFDLRGPNFTTDAACASALAATSAAVHGLARGDYDAVITGGIDRNMGVYGFVKFCKIGALSATGTRPFDAGADGFVMGEGAALFVLKRLADAERDGDRVYAVLLGLGGASDGKGKGITAPNPVGQRLAVERAWASAGLKPASASAVEAHGTSTRVGDAAELESLGEVFGRSGVEPGSIALGSVKSNIGHLKAASGAAGLFKMVMQLHERVLVPSLGFHDPNPNVDWDHLPFSVNSELRDWPTDSEVARRGGVSAFGFGGTNFHAVLEEYVPGLHRDSSAPRTFASADVPARVSASALVDQEPAQSAPTPLRGAVVVGARDDQGIVAQLESLAADAADGRTPPSVVPDADTLAMPVRVAVDYADASELEAKAGKAVQAFRSGSAALWKMLRAQGVFVGRGPAPKVAFLYTGQGSQYVNMLTELRAEVRVVAETFAEADRIMTPVLGRTLSSYIFIDESDPAAVRDLEQQLTRTEITQPAILTVDLALTRLLAEYDVRPDMVMGHSLGEYGALVAAGAMTFEAALEAVSARGQEMASISVADNGALAAVFGPLDEIERVVASVDSGVVVANINSLSQGVIGGPTEAVERAVEVFAAEGINAIRIPVSHAFHTSIVAPATEPLRQALRRLDLHRPVLPIVANVTGDFYPEDADRETMLDLLGRQVASPVQFVRGLRTLYDAGARVFVEVGPKRALHGFVEDVLHEHEDMLALFTNHPKNGDVGSVNAALCGLWAAGLGGGSTTTEAAAASAVAAVAPSISTPPTGSTMTSDTLTTESYVELGHLFAGVLEQGLQVTGRGSSDTPAPVRSEPVVITGAALGLPGVPQVFDDENLQRILDGQQFIDTIPQEFRQQQVDLHITRLVKRESGDPTFEAIDDKAEVVKLAGRHAPLDVVEQFGIDPARDAALDVVTRLAIGAGFDAMRDAGLPLVMRYKTTSLGSKLPERWGLPDALRDDTGVIFASAFPGYTSFAHDLRRYYTDRGRREQFVALEAVRSRMQDGGDACAEIDRRIAELGGLLESESFSFDRRFLFRCLSMGHSQFAEIIGARGPNTQINAACASTTQALSLAEDWIRAGRCRRVVVVSADDVTGDELLPWVTAGFLASGAAATDDSAEDAAIPFDRRRHGMVVGMGAASFVVEAAEATRERGLRPICEVLGAVTANSAFHGTRLDLDHIAHVMETVVGQAEQRGVDRHEMAASTVFVSHETYTPARGGSASAEINALRSTFGSAADSIVIANTKGFTGHAMGAGIEDVVAIKALETGVVPPVPNFKEPDPELGELNLSQGGTYPVRYALRLAAGFGSQIAMSLLRWTPLPDGLHRSPSELGYAYRITDPEAWQRWLDSLGDGPGASLEVSTRRLRVVDTNAPSVEAALPPATQPVTATVAGPATPAAPPPVNVTTPAPVGPAPAAETPVAAGPSDDEVTDAVVAIVAEMTGYPPELLDLDLDLEADLGVDTVKQAEVFAAVRTRFGVERDETLSLRDFPTLAHVIGWVRDQTTTPHADSADSADSTDTTVEPVAQATPAEVPAPAAGPSQAEVTEAVVAIVAEMTGYPPELLDLDLDLEADLGVDTVKQAEVFAAVRTRFGVERDETLSLRDFPTLAHVIGWVRDQTTTPHADSADSADSTDTTVEPVAQATPAEVPAPAAGPSQAEVTEAVVAIVAEMTGYPPELLDLDLDLEADLGVDTVKQAEVFAAVRTRFGVERDETLSLRDFPTLAHVIGWVRDQTTTEAGPESSAPVTAPAPRLHLTTVVGALDAVDALPRREPVPVLRPAPGHCVSTGVVLGADTRVVMMRDTGGVADVLHRRLADLGVLVLMLDPAKSTEQILSTVDAWRSEGEIAGVYWLPALDDEGRLDSLALADVHEGLRRRVKALYAVMRRLYDDQAFLVAGTRLGGFHGYDAAGATAPLGGAVTGFAKSYKRERPEALVKAVDVSLDTPAESIADLLVSETCSDPGCVEVGYAEGRRWGVGLSSRPFPPQDAPTGNTTRLGPDSVVLVTGAAGSIVAAVTADLARAAGGGTFHLLDLTPEPDPTDTDLRQYLEDRDGFKTLLATRMKDLGLRPTPVAIEKELAGYERRAAALTAIDAVIDAGGTVHYHSVDLTDPARVAQVMGQVRESSDRIDLLLHAAGVEVSRALPGKEPREFDLVFGVKADGWFNVMKAAGDLPIGTTVVFSSVAGRFGNAGQCDYAAANDLLCKITSSLRRTRPDTRALAVDWTAWGGIGMATRGSTPAIMEMAGVQMLPPEAGAAWIRRELTGHGFRGEVVAAGALGRLGDGYHPTGGVERATLTSWGSAFGGEVVEANLLDGLVVRTTLDPMTQPFLDDHRIDGTAVLPGVMGMELFAEVAALLAPEWYVVAVENVDFLVPVKFYRDEPRTLTVTARTRPDGSDLLAECRLEAERVLPGSESPQRTVHFTGSVRLSAGKATSDRATPVAKTRGAAVIAPSDVYRLYFHGPAYQVVGGAWADDGAAVGSLAEHLPSDQAPAGTPTLLGPRLEELCFQTAGLWEAGCQGRLALPSHVDRLSVLGEVSTDGGEELVAIARPTPGTNGVFDCQVLDADGRVVVRLDGYHTVPMPGPLADEVRAPLRAVLG